MVHSNWQIAMFGLVAIAVSLSAGCTSTNPPAVPQLDASVRKPLNQHLQADPTASKRLNQMRITVAQAIEMFVPPAYQVFVDEGIDKAMLIHYDNSRPWTESLGLSLAKVGVDMVADLDRRMMILKAVPTTLGQVLDTHVPAGFKVYVDQGVDLTTVVVFDHKRPWAEELGRSLSSVGVDFIANLDKKIVLVRRTTANSVPAGATANKGPSINPIKQLKN